MKVKCPHCEANYKVEESKIPEKGTHTKCPKCQTRFLVRREPTRRENLALITCPKCGNIQKPSEECKSCGIIISKYKEIAENKEISIQQKQLNQEESPEKGSACSKCGGSLSNNPTFCLHCGNKIVVEDSTTNINSQIVPNDKNSDFGSTEDNQKQSKPPQKKTSVLGWVFGCIFLMTGVGTVFSEPLVGLIFIFMAVLLIPPTIQGIEKRLKYNLSNSLKAIIIIVCLTLGGVLAEDDSKSDSNKPTARKKSSTSTSYYGQKVSNSAWDGSVYQVESFLKKNLKDPSSFKAIEWSPVVERPDRGYQVRCKYRAKNSFGGYVVENKIFVMDSNGNVTTYY